VTVIVLLGAPGAGKGTQAAVLRDRLGLPHIATGDLFRAAVREGTRLGLQAKGFMDVGQLVPDDVTTGMLVERLARPDAAAGAILDGFPRTRPQAAALDAVLEKAGSEVHVALLIDVPEEDLMARLTGRWICAAAGHVYHETSNPPREPGRCDLDGSPLWQRDDDRAEIIRARLEGQLSDLAQVVDHYRDRGVLVTVDGRRSIAEVSADLVAAVRDRRRGGAAASAAS